MAINLNDIEIFSDLLGNNFSKNAGSSGSTTNAGTGGNLLNILGNIINQVPPTPSGPQLSPDNFGSYVIPDSDPTFSTGQQYARSIASGGNIPGMIAPGVSYSSAIPGGFTQDDINRKGFPNPFDPNPNPIYNPPGGGPGGGGYNPPGRGGGDDFIFNPPVVNPPVNDPVDPPINFPPINFPPINIGGPVDPPINIGGPVPDPVIPPIGFPPINFPPIDPPINVGGPVGGPIPDPVFPPMPPINIGGPVGGPVPDPVFPPIDFPIDDPIQVPPPKFIDPPFKYDPPINIGGPVDTPIMPPINIGGPVDFPPKIDDQLFIDDRPGLEDILRTDYKVPEVPLNNLLNQNPPQGPVGMSPQETAKVSSQQELLNLISNKDVLSQIPADDGVRNQYQVELDEYINKSPINMDTYKEELPVGSTINLGIPAFMEAVVPMAVPGLGLAQNISNSLSSNNNPSPAPRPSSPSVSRPSTSRPNYSHSQVSKFGR